MSAGGGGHGGGGGGETYYAFEGYPIDELGNRYHREAYRLQEYEHKALEDIRICYEKGKLSRNQEMCEENILYVQSLIKKLSLVMASEQHDGIMNTELRSKIDEIKVLYSRLMSLLPKEKNIYTNAGMDSPGHH